jgi:tRNA(fMet)-specific endonuclease VapC
MTDAYLLDTNAVIALSKHNPAIEAFIQDKEIFVPVVAIAELFYGAENSDRRAENLTKTEAFAKQRVVLNCDLETARWYGRIFKQLKDKGKPIPRNDVWIAAIAMQYDLTVVTQDAHFNNVDNLKTASW